MSVFRGRTATVQYTRVSGVGSTQIDKLKKTYLFSQECAPVCLISDDSASQTNAEFLVSPILILFIFSSFFCGSINDGYWTVFFRNI